MVDDRFRWAFRLVETGWTQSVLEAVMPTRMPCAMRWSTKCSPPLTAWAKPSCIPIGGPLTEFEFVNTCGRIARDGIRFVGTESLQRPTIGQAKFCFQVVSSVRPSRWRVGAMIECVL